MRLNKKLRALLWATAGIIGTAASYYHFKHGSFIWAMTDIPFVLLLFYAAVNAISERN